jgi:hypothetical protein
MEALDDVDNATRVLARSARATPILGTVLRIQRSSNSSRQQVSKVGDAVKGVVE